MKRVVLVLAAVFLLVSAAMGAQDAKLQVIVLDSKTSEPLIGAAVMIEGTTIGQITDFDGKCLMEIRDKKCKLVVSYIGYTDKIIELGGGEKNITVLLDEDMDMLENATVTARKRLEGIQALQQERINSSFAIENIGAKEMSLKGISNAQESVVKLSGISVADAGQIIVRGLGDRYSTTTLNGLPIASPNPDNKLIPLDIFPASTIQNITVSKVYEASSFADYSGAHVDLRTKEGSENSFNIGISSGGLFGTIGQRFGRMDGPSLWSTNLLDSRVQNIEYSAFGDYIKTHDVFKGGFNSKYIAALPDLSGNIGYSHSFNVKDNKLNLLMSASIKSSNETIRDAFYHTYEASSTGSKHSTYIFDSYSSKLDIAALTNLGYSFKEADNISLTAFFARNAKETFMDRKGWDYLEGYDLTGKHSITHFYMLQNYQLAGYHENDSQNFILDWGASASLTSSDEPDRRQAMFRQSPESGEYKFFTLNQQETQRYFGKLRENEYVANVKASYLFNENYKINVGLTGKFKTRSFSVTRFYYDVRGINETVGNLDDLEKFLGFDAISNGTIIVNRRQPSRDKYDAFNAVGAAFVEADLQFSDNWFLNAGLRFEAGRQSVDYNDDVADQNRKLDALDLFPAINLKYSIGSQSAFRLSLSRTVTRPSFVEMAPFLYQESFGGMMIRGNEELQNGYNYNADLRYEFFRSGSSDMVAATAYFKYLDKPIERTQRMSGGAAEHSFRNADNGIAAGVEIELRKKIVSDFEVNANASYMYTNVKLPSGGSYTNPERELQDASPYLANVDLIYAPTFKGGSSLSLALMYNLQGPRIQAVGVQGIGDVKQMTFHSLDFSSSYRFNTNWSISLAFQNILNQPVRLRQDIPNAGKTVDLEYSCSGPAFKIGITYSL